MKYIDIDMKMSNDDEGQFSGLLIIIIERHTVHTTA